MPPNARDTLYQNLPPNIKFSLRSKILSFHVKEQVPSHFTNALITKHQFCTSNGQDKFKLELKELADFMLGSFKLNFVSILCPLLLYWRHAMFSASIEVLHDVMFPTLDHHHIPFSLLYAAQCY